MLTSDWGSFVKGVSARIDEIIDETKDMGPGYKESGLFKEMPADGMIYRTNGVTGLGYTEKFEQGDKIKTDRTYPAYETEYAMIQHGKVVDFSQMLMKTRPAELENKLSEVKQLMVAANRTLNKWAWSVISNGFSTTNASADFPISRLGDSVAMYSASHPSKVAGVANRSNQLSGNPTYGETAQFLAITQIREMLNGRGLPIDYQGKFVVVVPPKLEKLAVEINKSVRRSGTANNDMNYYEGIVDVISTTYIGAANGGSDTAWYVFATDTDQASLRHAYLIDPKIETQVDFFTKSINVSVDYACAFGYSNFEFTVASTGLNA